MATAAVSFVPCVLLCLLAFLPPLDSSPQCDHYGGCRNYPFLPAPPGRTPSCAKPGQTYCEKIEHYPTQLIRYLIEQWGYDYSTLLSDESRDDFNYRTPVPYGPHHHPHRGYTYGPPKLAVGVPLSYYPLQLVAPPAPVPAPAIPPPPLPVPVPVPAQGPAPNASAPAPSGGGGGGVGGGGGYPDRRYKLPPHQQHFLNAPYLYTTLLQPAAVSHYNPDEWWTRYARSNRNVEGNAGLNHQTPARSVRHRRQADNSGTNSLCPTTRRFIMPKAAMNNQGNWMYVVNLNEVDDRYTQLVGTETCVSNRCNGICSLPNGYTSRCEQQYVQKRLVALEPSGNQLYTEVFWFPHCCVCQITQTG